MKKDYTKPLLEIKEYEPKKVVSALDSYLYEEVSFTITASDGSETKTLVEEERVTTEYTHSSKWKDIKCK